MTIEPTIEVRALTAAGLGPVIVRDVVVAELDADVPGALGRMMNTLADAEVVLLAQAGARCGRH